MTVELLRRGVLSTSGFVTQTQLFLTIVTHLRIAISFDRISKRQALGGGAYLTAKRYVLQTGQDIIGNGEYVVGYSDCNR